MTAGLVRWAALSEFMEKFLEFTLPYYVYYVKEKDDTPTPTVPYKSTTYVFSWEPADPLRINHLRVDELASFLPGSTT